MEVHFNNKDLNDLYTTGKSSKFKNVPTYIVRKLPMAVDVLKSITVIQDIWKYPGYKFEALINTKFYSLRFNKVWRLILDIEWKDKNKTVGIIGLEDLSHHYDKM